MNKSRNFFCHFVKNYSNCSLKCLTIYICNHFRRNGIWRGLAVKDCSKGQLVATWRSSGRLRGAASRQNLCKPLFSCNMGGWWPSRNVYFKCLMPRNSQPGQRGRPHPPRENQFLVRAPQATGGGNPTYRKHGSQVPLRPLTW